MNYSLCADDLPDSGPFPIVHMEISLKGEIIGKLLIRLYREAFPAGVENFVRIASGKTYRIEHKGIGKYKYTKEIRRTYEGCKFFSFLYNNYAITGDIYKNNGTDAGSVFCDSPIPSKCLGPIYFPHDRKGLITLVPFTNEKTGEIFYDSTFAILLDDIKPSNNLAELNCNHVVIGQIYSGLEVVDKMNKLFFPYAGRSYPLFTCAKVGVFNLANSLRKRNRFPYELPPNPHPEIHEHHERSQPRSPQNNRPRYRLHGHNKHHNHHEQHHPHSPPHHKHELHEPFYNSPHHKHRPRHGKPPVNEEPRDTKVRFVIPPTIPFNRAPCSPPVDKHCPKEHCGEPVCHEGSEELN